jgi:hypothetical protein
MAGPNVFTGKFYQIILKDRAISTLCQSSGIQRGRVVTSPGFHPNMGRKVERKESRKHLFYDVNIT